MTTKVLWLLVAAAIATAACEEPTPRDTRVARRPRLEAERDLVVPRDRSATRSVPHVVNGASGMTRLHVKRAVADLKAVGMWRPLTRRLAVVQIQSRSGRARVPPDGHLADAYWTAVVEQDVVGGLCSIALYPAAVAADRRRAAALYRRGVGPDLPRPRAFWAGLLAHELAHCLPGQPGEGPARRWERRALKRLADAQN